MSLNKKEIIEFRRAIKQDMEAIMNIIRQAQTYLKEQGLNQWQNNYPNENVINQDMDNSNSYVLLRDNKIVGTVAVIFDGEKTYNTIYKGQWINHGEYATIHRLAVDSHYRGKGISSLILKNIEKMCEKRNIFSIRVDTHRGNMPMQYFLKSHGFQYCGIIYLEDGNERLAYEKVLK